MDEVVPRQRADVRGAEAGVMGAQPAAREAGTGLRMPPRMAGLWLIGVGLYLAAITYVGWGNVAQTVRTLDLRWLALGAFVELCALWIRAGKWRLVLGPERHPVTQFFLSKAAGSFTPGRVGELSPLLLERFRHPRTGAWIVLDRLMEASATLLFGFAGAIYMAGLSPGNAMLLWFALVAAGIAATFLVMLREDFARRLRAVVRPEGRSGLLGRLAGFVCDAAEEVRELGPKTPLLGLMTVLVTGMDIFFGFCLYLSFGESVHYLILATVQCAHAIVSVIPVSSNVTGIPYAVSAGFLHEAANVPLDVLAAAIAVRFMTAAAVFWPSFAVGTRGLFRRDRFADQGELFDYLASGEVLYAYSDAALEAVRRTVGSAGRALDIGCGDGVFAKAIDGDVVGLDISVACVRGAAARGVPAVAADAQRGLPFPADAFDTVACIDVLHHLDRDWKPLLEELGRVLKPGGRLVIIEPDARNRFVRWTQAPGSPVRVAPWPNEPAIHPEELEGPLEALGYDVRLDELHLDGEQTVRDVFPMWQRVLKAPFVLALARLYRGQANKFVLIATKPERGDDGTS